MSANMDDKDGKEKESDKGAAEKGGMSGAIGSLSAALSNALALGGLIFLTLALPFLTIFSQGKSGTYLYDPTALIVHIEFAKLIFSLSLLSVQYSSTTDPAEKEVLVKWNWTGVVMYIPPAVSFAILNNCNFLALQHIDATTFALSSQLKTPLAALLLVVMLARQLTLTKIIGLATMCFAVTFTALDKNATGAGGDADEYDEYYIPAIWLMVFLCLLSASTNVYIEMIMKSMVGSLNIQNAQLYVMGILVNILTAYIRFSVEGHAEDVLPLILWRNFMKYSIWVWILAFVSAFRGQLTGYLLKYADSNIVNISNMCSMMLAPIFQGILGNPVSLTKGYSVALGLMGMYIYFTPEKVFAAEPGFIVQLRESIHGPDEVKESAYGSV